jgi:hypothetical protein
LNKNFGNFLTLVTLAESGIFGATIYEVANTLLYDAFSYLNAIAAKDKYIAKLNSE